MSCDLVDGHGAQPEQAAETAAESDQQQQNQRRETQEISHPVLPSMAADRCCRESTRQIAICRPPSTLIVSPVMYVASATRKWTVLATSSGVPSRFSSVCEMMRWRDTSSNVASSGHRIGPGATAFTRTSGASSRASDRVSATSPDLATE